jgi:hypothetical protein
MAGAGEAGQVEELLVYQNHDDLAIRVMGETHTDPTRDLTSAAMATTSRPTAPGTNANRPAVNGERAQEGPLPEPPVLTSQGSRPDRRSSASLGPTTNPPTSSPTEAAA